MSITVKFKYVQLVGKEKVSREREVSLRLNTYLHVQWEEVVRQLQLKKAMEDYSINHLYPVKVLPNKFVSYIEFVPIEGDMILLMNFVGAKSRKKSRKGCCTCSIF